jgi:Tol biopolymer transport system component
VTASGSNEQVAVTTRPDRGNTFGAVSFLPSPVNTSSIDGTPELSADGLSLYFFSQRLGGTGNRDLYVATRSSTAAAFDTVRELTSINSPQRDDRPWVSPDELSVYFCSQRAALRDDLWRATRSARTEAFGTPAAVTELNSDGNDAGIMLTADGKLALFASDRSGGLGGLDIYRAFRASTSDAFSTPERVAELSSSADDFDVQLSADGQEVFFASNRNSVDYRIWRSSVSCP